MSLNFNFLEQGLSSDLAKKNSKYGLFHFYKYHIAISIKIPHGNRVSAQIKHLFINKKKSKYEQGSISNIS